MLIDKSILITGGTGSLGKALNLDIFLKNTLMLKDLVIFSQEMSRNNFKWLRNILVNIRKYVFLLEMLEMKD